MRLRRTVRMPGYWRGVAVSAQVMLFAGMSTAGLNAQDAVNPNSAAPALHQRSERSETRGDTARGLSSPQGPTSLPSEASGEYQLGKPGDVIEIILDHNGLTGYISMLGKSDRDKEVPLTYFFDQTELKSNSLLFTTKPVHGQWYSFQGTVVRGPAPTRAKEGYYLLQGQLSLHSNQGEQLRDVSLPLARSENG